MNYTQFKKSIHRDNLKMNRLNDLSKLKNLATELGLNLVEHKVYRHYEVINYIAETKTINLCTKVSEEEIISNLAHEIGHYLVATPEERKMDNFGLAQSPDDDQSSHWEKEIKTTNRDFHSVEEEASIAGMMIEFLLGFNPSFTYFYHCWSRQQSDQKEKDIFKTYNRTISRLVPETHIGKERVAA